jgi:hypothetical protein
MTDTTCGAVPAGKCRDIRAHIQMGATPTEKAADRLGARR